MDYRLARGHCAVFSSFGFALFMLILGGFIVCDLDLVQNLQALFKFENVAAKNGSVDLELKDLMYGVAEGPSLFFDLKAAEAPIFYHPSEAEAPVQSESWAKKNAGGPGLSFDFLAAEAPRQQIFGHPSVQSEAEAAAPSESARKKNAACESSTDSPATENAAVVTQSMVQKNAPRDGLQKNDLGTKQCNLFSGKWVFDPDYPLYQSSACPFMESRFRCLENGRTDSNYTKLRWQPHHCNIPRFDPTSVLQLLRNKRVVFSGDSIGRNQWESFVCMLYQGVPDKRNVYEVRGQRISRKSGEFSVRFADYNATIEFYGAHFLVMEIEGPPYQLRLDKMSRMSKKWLGADVLVFNSAHWWDKVGLVQSYQERKKVNLTMDSLFAYSKGMHYWAKWIDSHLDPAKVRVFFRAIAPTHFQQGQWNTGGVCHLDREPILNESSLFPYPAKKMGIVERLILKMKTPVTFLNITMLTGYRKDGHISIWRPESKGNATETRLAIQDCSHWCLPGVPDTWNELLSYALLRDWGQR